MLNNLIAANQSTVFESAAVSDCLYAIEVGITADAFSQDIKELENAALNAFLAMVGA